MLTLLFREKSPAAVVLFFYCVFCILAGPVAAETVESISQNGEDPRMLQEALAELAQGEGETNGRKSCHTEATVEECASCCRSAKQACVELVIPLCHQGGPDRAEFRHCTRDRERRCQTDFDNCAWLCGRVK